MDKMRFEAWGREIRWGYWAASLQRLPWNVPCFSSSPFSSCTPPPTVPRTCFSHGHHWGRRINWPMSRLRDNGVKWPHMYHLPSISKSPTSWALRCISYPEPLLPRDISKPSMKKSRPSCPNFWSQRCPMLKHSAIVYEALLYKLAYALGSFQKSVEGSLHQDTLPPDE